MTAIFLRSKAMKVKQSNRNQLTIIKTTTFPFSFFLSFSLIPSNVSGMFLYAHHKDNSLWFTNLCFFLAIFFWAIIFMFITCVNLVFFYSFYFYFYFYFYLFCFVLYYRPFSCGLFWATIFKERKGFTVTLLMKYSVLKLFLFGEVILRSYLFLSFFYEKHFCLLLLFRHNQFTESVATGPDVRRKTALYLLKWVKQYIV